MAMSDSFQKYMYFKHLGVGFQDRDKLVPVTTAWRFLRLRMEEQACNMEGSYEYIE
jgi:hypothetical protein